MNAIATRLHVYVSGAVIFALNHNENEVEIYSKHNNAFNGSTGHTHTGATGDGPILTAASLDLTGAPQLVPLGSIIPFYDFNGALTFNTQYWAYCNGQTKTIAAVPRVLPDLSGRYIVGFGTDGGADLGTASWNASPVGNAAHQINLEHSHTVNSHTHDLANHTHTGAAHTHDLANHTHTGPSHSHGAGSLVFPTFSVAPTGGAPRFYGFSGGSTSEIAQAVATAAGADFFAYKATSNFAGGTTYETDAGSGSTASGGTGTTSGPSSNTSGSTTPGASSGPSSNTSGAATPGMDVQLSTTQSIQPRSIRVRYIMRIL